jgi:hypothetical protein
VPVADTGITPTPISEMAGTAVPVVVADETEEVELRVWVSWDWVAVSVAAVVVEVWPPLLLEGDDELSPVLTSNLHCFSCRI